MQQKNSNQPTDRQKLWGLLLAAATYATRNENPRPVELGGTLSKRSLPPRLHLTFLVRLPACATYGQESAFQADYGLWPGSSPTLV